MWYFRTMRVKAKRSRSWGRNWKNHLELHPLKQTNQMIVQKLQMKTIDVVPPVWSRVTALPASSDQKAVRAQTPCRSSRRLSGKFPLLLLLLIRILKTRKVLMIRLHLLRNPNIKGRVFERRDTIVIKLQIVTTHPFLATRSLPLCRILPVSWTFAVWSGLSYFGMT